MAFVQRTPSQTDIQATCGMTKRDRNKYQRLPAPDSFKVSLQLPRSLASTAACRCHVDWGHQLIPAPYWLVALKLSTQFLHQRQFSHRPDLGFHPSRGRLKAEKRWWCSVQSCHPSCSKTSGSASNIDRVRSIGLPRAVQLLNAQLAPLFLSHLLDVLSTGGVVGGMWTRRRAGQGGGSARGIAMRFNMIVRTSGDWCA